MIEKFFTTEQVANILQVHPFTILKFIKAGSLSGIKLGRVYRIKESDVMQFLEDRSVGKPRKAKPEKVEPEQPKAQSPQVASPEKSYEVKPESSGQTQFYSI